MNIERTEIKPDYSFIKDYPHTFLHRDRRESELNAFLQSNSRSQFIELTTNKENINPVSQGN